jgi:replicative DNA helicase
MGNIITANHMRDPRLVNQHTHIPAINRLSEELRNLPIWIDDTSPLQINKLIARIRMMRRKMGIRLFIVDYLQLIESRKARSETEEAKANVFALRDLVKAEPTIHLLAISQYSHSDGFSKKGKRYKKHLYGGSALEHAVQNIFRFSIEDAADKERNDLLDVEINIDKIREGRRQKVTCMFDQDHLTYCYPQPPLRT